PCSPAPPPPLSPTPFPYTTLFRSRRHGHPHQRRGGWPRAGTHHRQVPEFHEGAGYPAQPATSDAGCSTAVVWLVRFQWWLRYGRSEEHTSELQSRFDLVCRLLLEK